MSSLLVVERMVIESLGGTKEPQGISSISDDTGLSEPLIRSILFHLVNKGIVVNRHNKVSLNWETKEDWLPILKNKEGIKMEIKELFSALVNHHYHEQVEGRKIKLKKAWLTDYEQSLLQNKLKELDEFLDKLSKKRDSKSKLKEQKVLIWGMSGYQTLVNELLHAI